MSFWHDMLCHYFLSWQFISRVVIHFVVTYHDMTFHVTSMAYVILFHGRTSSAITFFCYDFYDVLDHDFLSWHSISRIFTVTFRVTNLYVMPFHVTTFCRYISCYNFPCAAFHFATLWVDISDHLISRVKIFHVMTFYFVTFHVSNSYVSCHDFSPAILIFLERGKSHCDLG